MPIIDIHLVCAHPADVPPGLARAAADALGAEFRSEPGRVWVRVSGLPVAHYAENGVDAAAGELPVFVTVLHAQPPEGAARATEALAVSRLVAACVGRHPERVHIEYAPAGRGRIAFGGRLVT